MFIKIYWSEDSKLAFDGDELADQTDYDFELSEYQKGRCPSSILSILVPGQDIALSNGKFCIADDLSLLVYED